MIELNRRGDELVESSHPDSTSIRSKQKELNDAWSRLRKEASLRQERLFGAHEIQRLNRDIDEAITWISEKESIISSDDYGKDLNSVQALQRIFYLKLEGLVPAPPLIERMFASSIPF